MAEIRIGLVGYGNWARHAYLPALARDGRGRVGSVTAYSAATRGRAREELGRDVQAFENLDALLLGPKVDALMIAVPDSAHESTLLAALEAQIPVFYEPPVSHRRDRVPAALRRLLTVPALTQADLELRFVPVVQRARQIVRAGHIGTPRQMHVQLNAGWGVSTDVGLCTAHILAPWYVDVLNHVLNRQPNRILVMDSGDGLGRMQSQTLTCLDYGVMWATLRANLNSVAQVETFIEVNGDDGDVNVDLFAGTLRVRTRNGRSWSHERLPAQQPHAGWPGMHECVSAFLDAVQNDQPAPVTAREVTSLHLLGLAAEQSKDRGGWAVVSTSLP